MTHPLLNELQKVTKSSQVKKQIINLLIKNKTMTIGELAKEVDLSIPTITKFVDEMSRDEYLVECGKLETGGGRHPNLYGLYADACYFVGGELSKDGITLGLMNFKGEMIVIGAQMAIVATEAQKRAEEICKHVDKFISLCEVKREKILNVCIAITGRVNPKQGFSFSMLNMGERAVAEYMEELLQLHVVIDNDTRALAYGEYMLRDGEKDDNFLFINIGWGLGMAVILEGKPQIGVSGFAGEIGHNPVYDNQVICHCGKKGCIETEVSGSALYRHFLESIKNGENSIVLKKRKHIEEITLNDILEAVKKEDVLAIELVEKISYELGKHIAGLVNIFNPATIIIGGELSKVDSYLLHPVISAIRKYTLSLMYRDTDIHLSKLEQRGHVVGACYLGRFRAFES